MLPPLREELSLYRAAPAADGEPGWSLYDPVRNLFFRIDWLSFEILKRWSLGRPENIAGELRRDTTLDADADDVESVALFLHQNQLLQPLGEESTRSMLAMQEQGRQHWYHWLFHRYLFFRVPLWRPDRWLSHHVAKTAPLYSRAFLLLSALVLVAGLFLVGRQWSTFSATLVDMFKPASLPFFALTLIAVKWLHELGHAFTAKRYGCKVPTMGVAFLVLFPLAYTDVNDAWRLPSRRQRLLVGAAGILVELLLAAWATFAWALMPDGLPRDALFLIATTTWVSTVLINASPFLRFDGYFLLMDALDLPNLHQRSFALGIWQLRRWLFASEDPLPEHFSPKRHAGLVALAFAAWTYRLVVFVGIAVLVYYFFPKPLGPFLAAMELVWFIGLPAYRELRQWPQQLSRGWSRAAGRRWLWLLALILALTVLPWNGRISTQGLLQPTEFLRVVAPGDGIVRLTLSDGARVMPGDAVASLSAPGLESQRLRAGAREASARWQADVAALEDTLREQREVLLADSARSAAERQGLDRELGRFQLVADMEGRFVSDIERGAESWIGEGDFLGVIADTRSWEVETYVAERDIHRIDVGDSGKFYPETAGLKPLHLTLTGIEADASRQLSDPMLSSVHGGDLLVRSTERALVPERAVYRVRLRVEGVIPRWLESRPQVLRGRVNISGERQALLGNALRAAASVFVREAGI